MRSSGEARREKADAHGSCAGAMEEWFLSDANPDDEFVAFQVAKTLHFLEMKRKRQGDSM